MRLEGECAVSNRQEDNALQICTGEQNSVLVLLRRALWSEPVSFDCGNFDWLKIETEATRHSILALIYGASTPLKKHISSERYQAWRKCTLSWVVNSHKLIDDQDELTELLENANITYAILKGTSVSRYYPVPDLRILGDIDLLVRPEDIEQVDQILLSSGYSKRASDDVIHHEYWRANTLVEVHFALMNTPDSCGGRKAEQIADQCLDNIEKATLGDHSFFVLTEPFQAFSLLLHMQRHMLISGIGLRQIADWAVYIDKADYALLEKETIPILQKTGLFQYAKVLTKMCVLFLGLDEEKVQWCCDADNELCCRLWKKVLQWGSLGQEDIEGMGNLFTDRKKVGNRGGSYIVNLISLLNRIAYREFPWTENKRFFLPVMWIYIPIRYVFRALIGKRPYKNVLSVLNNSRETQNLFEKMKLFQIDE